MTNKNKYFVANWKMNGTNKSINLHKKIIQFAKKNTSKSNIIYCPPYTLIRSFIAIGIPPKGLLMSELAASFNAVSLSNER